ncbi:hypothetical protein [Ralstonia phage phiRSL1]|uniref:Uncharacterized protein n=1 Tax=Ralstonia phage phiRSL1 TaxID=1980924 RepID=B2ZXV9_9CAUD|nr:hypothetical protein RSL1_ORF090 [Ralstonia phage phiRSL1]BAG41535.1 hypothetical protein [Ralstonia phage phiRSL1]
MDHQILLLVAAVVGAGLAFRVLGAIVKTAVVLGLLLCIITALNPVWGQMAVDLTHSALQLVVDRIQRVV